MAVGFTGTDFQAEPSILDPFRTIFDVFGSDLKIRSRPRLGPEPPTRPVDSGTFFWAPFRNFLPVFRRISRKCDEKRADKKFRNGAQKKVPESAGLVEDDLAVL